MQRTFLLATTLAAALAGCQSHYRAMGMAATPPPDTKNPKVWVLTKENCQAPYIVVAPEPLYIYKPGIGQTVTINWHLQTDGYSFDQKTPIANPDPVPGTNSPSGEIDQCMTGGAKNMHCRDKAVNSGSWKYTLRVVSDDEQKCPSPKPLDPNISNE